MRIYFFYFLGGRGNYILFFVHRKRGRMKWYLIQDVNDCRESIIEYLNSFEDMVAFVPRVMKYFKIAGENKILPKTWDDSYIIVKTELKYEEVFKRYWNLIQENSLQFRPNEDVVKFKKEEVQLLEQLFDEDIVLCSIGKIEEGKLIIEKGPLKGLERYVKKINRHKRMALLEINSNLSIMKVYLEVVSKS